MRFRFSLQPLLDARERDEDEARAILLAAAHGAACERARAAALRAQLAQAGRAFVAASLKREPAAVRTALVERELLLAALARAGALACAANEGEAAARREFAGPWSARRRIEVLRDRARATFQQAAERREERELEEARNLPHNAATLFAPSFHN